MRLIAEFENGMKVNVTLKWQWLGFRRMEQDPNKRWFSWYVGPAAITFMARSV